MEAPQHEEVTHNMPYVPRIRAPPLPHKTKNNLGGKCGPEGTTAAPAIQNAWPKGICAGALPPTMLSMSWAGKDPDTRDPGRGKRETSG